MRAAAEAGQAVPIAVIGAGAIMPGSVDVAGFWRTVLTGRDLITDVPSSHWLVEDYYDPDPSAPDKTYARRGAFLPEVEFDPMSFGMPPNTLPATDTAQLLALMVAAQVFDDAFGDQLSTMDRDRVSVVLGVSALDLLGSVNCRIQRPVWLDALRESGIPESAAQAICDRITARYTPVQEATFPGLLANVVAGRIANRFDLHGTNHVTDAACASSLAAVYSAVGELALGRADLVLTGGVDAANDIGMFLCFSKTPALSPTGDCRPFSDHADGTMLGEGLAMFALKRLADAERDGDRVHAVIRGIGTSSDGRGNAIYAPLAQGQVRALRRAYQDAGYRPDTVELVEAHGTGTTAGDLAEITALQEAFGESGRADRQWCALGSIKAQIGHTKAAAGAAGLLKAVLAVRHGVLTPTIKLDRPNPRWELDSSPFYPNIAARPWVRGEDHPRRASVSSFGFGGSNFHLTLEEYRPGVGATARPAWRVRCAPTELVLFSANSVPAMMNQVAAVDTGRDLCDIARQSQESFDATGETRLGVVVASTDDLIAVLAEVVTVLERDPAGPMPPGVHYACGTARPGRIGFLFPGQGAQYVGMGADIAMHEPVGQRVWDRLGCMDFGDRPLHRVVFPPPAFSDTERAAQGELLTATEWAQPALAVHSLALLGVLDAVGLTPDCVAGHSFGELVALCCAGAFTADDLVRLARSRGEAMREASRTPGAMLAIGATREQITAVLTCRGDSRVWLANHNGPKQIVLSGDVEAIEAVASALAEDGISAVRLDAAAAFHSPMVAAAAAPLRDHLRDVEVRGPGIAVYGNADAGVYPSEPDLVRRRIAEHLTSPVRFAEMIEAMYADGVRTFVEVGPKATLSGLTGAVLGDREHLAVSLDRRGRNGVSCLQEGLASLAVGGVGLDFAALWEPYAPVSTVPEKEPRMTVTINGANYAKPYPPAGGAEALLPANPEPAAPERVSMPSAAQPRAVVAEDGWIGLVEQAQQQTAQAHSEYQRMMTESHLAFLRMSEASFSALLGDVAPPGPVAEPAAALPAPSTLPAPAVPAPRRETAPARSALPISAAAPMSSLPESPEPALGGVGGVMDADAFELLLLSVVADCTGYPVHMVKPAMELEADLGIDSIKRVEVFAAVQREAGELPLGDIAELGKLRTLSEIIDRVCGTAPSQTATPAQAEVEPVTDPEVSTFVVRTRTSRPAGMPMSGLWDGPITVLHDGTDVADLVVAGLRAHDVPAVAADAVPPGARGLVLLGGPSADGEATAQGRALRAAREVAASFTDGGGLFVTVQDTGGDFGLDGGQPERAWSGGLAALAKTAAKEWPRASVKAIDCARAGREAEAVAAAIVRELLEGGDEPEVGLRADGSRLSLRMVSRAIPAAGVGVRPDSVIVATGGARGVTAAALTQLAAACQPRLVLLGRTALAEEPAGLLATDEPSLIRELSDRAPGATTPVQIAAQAHRILAVREVRATLHALARTGTRARYFSVDVCDAAAVAAALDEVRADWGPIAGIVHGAGVVADRLIAGKTDEEFSRVFATKVTGLRTLLDATAADPLELICLFSSVAGSFGNVGQSDYAMANAVLDEVASAEHAIRPGCTVRSIAWGPWRGGMVTPALAGHFADNAIALISPEAGARAFVAALSGPAEDVRVIIMAGAPESITETGARHVRVDPDTHPYLTDHRIADTAVLPMAVVLDWFAGTVNDRPEPVALRDIRVLRTVSLPGGRADLSLVDDGNVLELRGQAGTTCYRTRPAGSPPVVSGTDWSTPAGLVPLDRREVYDGRVLFHGPAFHALNSVEGVSEAGAAAQVIGVAKLSWAGQDWQIDSAAVDGALQVALLWAERVLGRASLPMAIGECRVHRPGPHNDESRCVVRAVRVHQADARCEIALLDSDGTPWVEMFDVDLVARPE